MMCQYASVSGVHARVIYVQLAEVLIIAMCPFLGSLFVGAVQHGCDVIGHESGREVRLAG